MTINLDQYTNTLSVTDTATNADLNVVPKGTGQTKATNLTSSIVSSVGQSGYGSFLAQGSTGNAAYYFGYVGSSEVGRITMTGNTDFGTSSSALLQLRVANTASAVNYVQVTGAATGGSPSISIQGSDANVGLDFIAKGSNGFGFTNSATAGAFGIELASNTSVDKITFIDFHSSAGTDFDFRLARQSGFNNFITYVNAGTGGHAFQTAGGTEQMRVLHTASTVNYLQATGAATGASPVLSAQGSDTNIDVTFTPKGTGNVRFGTYTGTILTPTGYVEIKDSGGTVRRLLVG